MILTPAMEQAIRAALADNPARLGTHWDGCSTYHWACGVAPLLAEIDRLRARIAEADAFAGRVLNGEEA